MTKVSTIGLDVAKHVFQVHGVDELGAVEMPDGFVWRPVRRHFGIEAFGVNGFYGYVVLAWLEFVGCYAFFV